MTLEQELDEKLRIIENYNIVVGEQDKKISNLSQKVKQK